MARAALLAFSLLVALVCTQGSRAAAQPSAYGRLSVPDHPRLKVGPRPEFVEDIAVDAKITRLTVEDPDVGPSDSEAPSAPASELLLSDYQVRIPASGPAIQFHRWAVRILSRSALRDLTSWSFDFDPEFETLTLHRVSVYRERWRGRPHSRSFLAHRETDHLRQIIDRRMTLTVVVDDVQVGDVIDISYSTTGKNPSLGSHYAGSASLGFSVPARRLHVLIDPDEEAGLHYRLQQGAPEPAIRLEDDLQRVFVWDLESTPAHEGEVNVPPGWIDTPWVEFSTFADWGDVAAWAVPLYSERSGLGSKQELDLFKLLTRPEIERVLLAREWVQENVRYLALLTGPHSLVPHSLSEIVRRRYGDCKDKALLLTAILDQSGVEAWPILVDTDRGWALESALPSPFAFDHVIVGANVDGREVWIDPTLRLQGGAEADQLLAPGYHWGLPVREDTRELAPAPGDPSARGEVAVHYKYALDEQLTKYQLEIETLKTGRHAEGFRAELEELSHADLQQSYMDYYQGFGVRAEPVADIGVADDRDSNQIQVSERYTVQPDGQVEEALFETLPLELEARLNAPESDELSGRRSPWRQPHPLRWRENVEIGLSQPWQLREVEATVTNPWFHFAVTSQASPGKIALDYRLDTYADRVLPEDLERYAREVDSVRSYLGYRIEDPSDPVLQRWAAITLGVSVLFVLSIAGWTLRWLSQSGVWREGRA